MSIRETIEDTLRRVNPGLTEQEINELVEALDDIYPEDTFPDNTEELLEESLKAVDKLIKTYESIEPQDVDDVISINEWKGLRYKISEAIRNYNY